MKSAESVGARNPHRPGRFITFEGGEGSGKSTQVQRLVARLAARGLETLATREPGGSPGAERLREIILSGAVKPFGAEAEALMFAAARADHLEKTIRPALAEGCFVVCDRFADSTRAYQGASGNVAPALIRALEATVVGDTMPDLTIVLDIPVADGMARAHARRADGLSDRFEAEDTAFHEKVRQAFLTMARQEPQRFVVIDARASADDIEAAIWREVETRLLDDAARADHREEKGVETPADSKTGLRRQLKVIESAARPAKRARARIDRPKRP